MESYPGRDLVQHCVTGHLPLNRFRGAKPLYKGKQAVTHVRFVSWTIHLPSERVLYWRWKTLQELEKIAEDERTVWPGTQTESNELDFRLRLSGAVTKPAYAAAWRKPGGGER